MADETPYWAVFEGGNVHDLFTTREMAEEMAYYKGEHATVGPLYTTPPQRPLMTDEELDQTTAQARDDLLDHIYEYGTNAEGVLERVRKLCRAIERKVRGKEE